jgi:hypothetical protein
MSESPKMKYTMRLFNITMCRLTTPSREPTVVSRSRKAGDAMLCMTVLCIMARWLTIF